LWRLRAVALLAHYWLGVWGWIGVIRFNSLLMLSLRIPLNRESEPTEQCHHGAKLSEERTLDLLPMAGEME